MGASGHDAASPRRRGDHAIHGKEGKNQKTGDAGEGGYMAISCKIQFEWSITDRREGDKLGPSISPSTHRLFSTLDGCGEAKLQ